MLNIENSMYGKKIFFFNPPLKISCYVMDSLKEDEYEVYKIADYRMAKPICERYPEAMCYFYIDEKMNYKLWFNFLKSFEYEKEYQNVTLGLVVGKVPADVKKQFLSELKLPGGVISLDDNLETLEFNLKQILQLNFANGTRRYFRLDCNGEKDINLYFVHGTKIYTMNVLDISTVGVTCLGKPEILELFPKNSSIQNVSFTIGKRSIVTSVFVIDAVKVKDGGRFIFLFPHQTQNEVKLRIRMFIYEVLERRMHSFVLGLINDNTDYDNYKFPDSAELTEITDAEDVENLEPLEPSADQNGEPSESAGNPNSSAS